jgi:hypothetical protein
MLPLFRVEGTGLGEAGGIIGTVTRTTHGRESWIGDRWIGYLVMGTRLVAGRWHARGNNWEFVPDDLNLVEGVLAHPESEVLDGYWGERAELVLDETSSWIKARFQPTDAVRTHGPGGVLLRPDDSSPPATGEANAGSETSAAEVVPDGWDHEHCAICWEKIGAGGQVDGYVNPERAWVCVRCYLDFVEPRSLNFVPAPPDQN